MQRFVGVAVLAVTGTVALTLWWAVGNDPVRTEAPRTGLLFGVWRFVYANDSPPLTVIAAAISSAAFLVALVVYVEHRIILRFRRSSQTRTNPLAPKVVMSQTSGQFHGEVTVTVVVPAHNEETSLAATLQSLWQQSHPPVHIVVVADNCNDSTEDVARANGAEVVRSVGNRHKKAGALNQALARILPTQGENDVLMIMDADTVLRPGFLEHAVARFQDDRGLMAVGGVFYGEQGHGLLGIFQRNEYVRYGREIGRRRGKVFVLTGTASLFRPRALRAVADARGTMIPGRSGDVFDVAALTEDNELTIALKSLGALMVSPAQCMVETELMPNWRALWNQRLRWQRGALENVGAYGFTPATLRYWVQQLGIGYGVFALASYIILLALLVVTVDHWVWFPFWLSLGGVFMAERVITVWRGDGAGRCVAALIFPELVYDLFIQLVFVKGVIDMSFGREPTWRHLSASDAIEEEVLA